MAIALMRDGQRVGVTALSHKAIHKFLDDLEEAAVEAGFDVSRAQEVARGEGLVRGRGSSTARSSNAAMLDPELQLVAGTSWLFAREDLDQHVDTLFIDEGGQFALADAIAVGTAARNLVLLGDPNQLPQVSQGSHPPAPTRPSSAPPRRGRDGAARHGIFLEHTWRMRPEVNAYVSEAFYEGRLEPAEVTSARSVAAGNGMRFLRGRAHAAHSQASPEEAGRCGEIERLVGTPYVEDGVERPLELRGLHRRRALQRARALSARGLPDGGSGRHRGQVPGSAGDCLFYSMASSSGEQVPRGLEFLFSRNRLNVASLARAVPRLRGREPAAPARRTARRSSR